MNPCTSLINKNIYEIRILSRNRTKLKHEYENAEKELLHAKEAFKKICTHTWYSFTEYGDHKNTTKCSICNQFKK